MNTSGFTLIDLMVVMGLFVAGFMAWMLLQPAMQGNRARPERIECVNNLKQIGVGFFSFASDHHDKFPMEVPITNGGTREFEGAAFKHFTVLSNDLEIPKILLCPADKRRHAATNFSTDLNNSKISYFVGIDCTKSNFMMLLSGDRNITNGPPLQNGILNLTTNEPAEWTDELHKKQGNAGLADGSVQQLTNNRLRDQIANSGVVTNRLAMP